jgi:phage/plasmid-like protein (TIGR03299 family)
MPANVETAAYANVAAWHREGVVIDTDGKKGMTIEQALPAGGLNWGVKKSLTLSFDLAHAHLNDPAKLAKAIAEGTQIPLSALMVNPGRYNTQRDTDGKLFGNVGETWVPFNPLDAFQIVDDLLDAAGGKAWIEACGALDEGRKVWVMVHLDTEFQIAGERYATYLTVVTGFDGRTSTMVFVHTERIVCANTLAIAVREGEDTGRILRVRHTKNAADRIKQAKHILGVRDQQLEELAKQGEWLVKNEMDDTEFATFLDSLMPLQEEDGPAKTMRQDRRGAISSLYFNAPNLEPIRGTRWGALQATIEYADHKRPFKDGESQLKAQWGFTSQQTEIKDRAFAILKTPGLALA